MKRTKHFVTTVFSGIVMALAAAVAPAQQIEEVTVTAQRRAESLQEVPVSVSAFNAELIEATDLHDLSGIAARTPGFTFAAFSPGQNILSLRGVSSNDDGAGTDNSVAVFLDDVYLGRVSNVNFEMFDLERIEVLRGPQGTLFGKNTIGGAINVITSAPSDELRVKVQTSPGRYDQLNFQGLVSGPIGGGWKAKLAATSRNRDGWVNNAILNKQQKDQNAQGVRLGLLWDNDDTEVFINADKTRDDTEDMARIPTRANGPDPEGGVRSIWKGICNGDTQCSANPVDGFAIREAQGASLKVNHEILGGTLTSVSAYRDNLADWEMDAVGAPLPATFYTEVNTPGRGGIDRTLKGTDLTEAQNRVAARKAAAGNQNIGLLDDIYDETEQYSQEFRFAGDLPDWSSNYVLGLFYLHEETDREECFRWTTGGTDEVVLDNDCYFQSNETDSVAAFAHVIWDTTDRLSFGLGARLTYDKKDFFSQSTADQTFQGAEIIDDNFTVSASENWTNFSPKGTVDYRPRDNVLLFGSISRGFKSGGFPAAPTSAEAFRVLEPETVTSYEMGVKSDWLEKRLRLNVTAFFADYKDLQFQQFGSVDGSAFGQFLTDNADGAEVFGLEVEFTLLPIRNLRFDGSWSYMDSKYTDYLVPVDQDPMTDDVQPLDVSGQQLTRTPEHKYSLSSVYTWNRSNGQRVDYRVDFSYTDDQRADIISAATVQPSYDLLDASVNWTSADSRWEVSAWVKNLTDEEYVHHTYIIGPGDISVFGDPRTWGLTFRYSM